MEKNRRKTEYICVSPNHFAGQLKLPQHGMSATTQFKESVAHMHKPFQVPWTFVCSADRRALKFVYCEIRSLNLKI